MTESAFLPGSLVTARGREWVVQPNSDSQVLRLRPLGGSDEDISVIIPVLEQEPVEPAIFLPPDINKHGTHDSAIMMRDALLLKMRNGAGAFRSFGNIAVEPRSYQLVPLLMALKQPVVRMLIADDVGIGKTIEAGLIIRELLDRGEISRFAVLCPPHLVEQWKSELKLHFNINAQDLTSSNVGSLERNLPTGVSLFEHYPYVIVSLDFIKSDRHKNNFISMAPECIVVDEAHTCANTGGNKTTQLRYDLLSRLVGKGKDYNRHLIMLTATPHSGKDEAFNSLLTLLDPKFSEFSSEDKPSENQKSLRVRLAQHFVQRRRVDIEEWNDTSIFPKHNSAEVTYKLTGKWETFFEDIRKYCVEMANRVEQKDEKAGKMIWYAVLALLRCISSSPASAVSALQTRLRGLSSSENQDISEDEESRLYDDNDDDIPLNDLEPATLAEETTTIKNLIELGKELEELKNDPKFAILALHLEGLIKDKFTPVVFCRYIATAKYVTKRLKERFGKKCEIDCVCGEYTPEERKERVKALAEAKDEKPVVLVATDCLSEGINLQDTFNAVIHYDLAWNPTRHEQREGRVDRFGQKSKEVRTLMIYGENNPVDGFILKVILRKAEKIKKELGIIVPMPENKLIIDKAILKSVLLKEKITNIPNQLTLGFENENNNDNEDKEMAEITLKWQDSMEKAKKNRAIFAQHRLKPEEVMPELKKQLELLGNNDDVTRFVKNACSRLGSALEPVKNFTTKQLSKFVPAHLPNDLKERLANEDIIKPLKLSFIYPAPAENAVFVPRSHPIVSLIADYIIEDALSGNSKYASRTAVTLTSDIQTVTTLYLVRLRHQLSYKKNGQIKVIMAEEMLTIIAKGRANPVWEYGNDLNSLLSVKAVGNLSADIVTKELEKSTNLFINSQSKIREIALERAQALEEDHIRVREASADKGTLKVTPCLPVDLIGIYVLLPDEL